MKRSLYSQELLKSLDNFVREMYRLDLADNPQLVFQIGIKWTRGQPLLTKKLLQYILEAKSKIHSGREAARVEKIIRQRLLKEFKHDDLTLAIRKILYVKDLARLLAKSQGQVGDREQVCLTKIQQNLGLSSQQSQNIQGQYSKSQLTSVDKKNKQQNSLAEKKSESPNSNAAAFQDLISLVENSPIYEELLAPNNSASRLPEKPPILIDYLRNKSFWFCLSIPFLLLIFRTINLQKNSQVMTTTNGINISHCSAKIESPRMSLGEKLLTQNQQLQSATKIALYEASEALSKCQYITAKAKFQQALELEPNNPEASIYLNNTKAISQTNPNNNLKIAVNVPLQERTDIAEEILRGIAQAQLEINQKGGIDSKLLLVQIVNEPQDSQLAEEIAQKLAADKTVLAAIGYNNVENYAIATRIYQQQGLGMISVADSHSSQTDDETIEIVPNISNLVNILFDYAAVSSFKKIAICADSNDITSSLFAREFATTVTQSGREITTNSCDFAQDNFNPVPIINRALAQNADAILLSPSADSIEQAISVAQIDRDRLALLGNHIFHTNRTINAGETVSQLVLTTPWLADTVTEQKFAHDARNLWETEVNWRSAMSYDATRVIALGLKQTQNRIELQSALRDLNFNFNEATVKSARLAYIGKSTTGSAEYQFSPFDPSKSEKAF